MQAFTEEVQGHEEKVEALRGEGEELKSQGGPDDMKRVDLWVEDLAQRLDELGGAIDDRQVGVTCLSYRQRSYYWCKASGRVIICIFLVISYFVQE